MQCSCKEWKIGIKSLAAAQTMAWTHGWEYAGKTFRFCPWCRKKLKDDGEGVRKTIKEDSVLAKCGAPPSRFANEWNGFSEDEKNKISAVRKSMMDSPNPHDVICTTAGDTKVTWNWEKNNLIETWVQMAPLKAKERRRS